MEEFIIKQKRLETEIDRIIRNYKKANKGSKSSVGYLSRRVDTLETEWQKFKLNHEEMVEMYDEKIHKELKYFNEDNFSIVEERVCELIGEISDIISQLQGNSSHCNQSSGSTTKTEIPQGQGSSELKLPTINLPKFCGDYKTWSSFHDLFSSLIDANKSLSPVQKLHYLKTNLSGEAEQLIRHLQITQANYKPAWDLLVKRYQNKRALLNAHLKTLFSIPTHTGETANALRTLMDTTRECLESIKGLNVDTNSWDPLIIHNLSQKLSAETLAQWELTLSSRDDPNDVPTINEFLSFIETRFRTLEAINLTRAKPHVREKLSFNLASRRGSIERNTFGKCQLCKQQYHMLKDCSQFLKLDITDRRAVVQKFSYCYNCLIPGHPVTKCRTRFNCRICGGRHHSLLHQHTRSEARHEGSDTIGGEAAIIQTTVNTSSKSYQQNESHTLLATALVSVKNAEGQNLILRALLDQGSEANLITQAVAQRLRLQPTNTAVHIKGIGGSEMAVAKRAVHFNLYPCHETSDIQVSVEALILPRLTGLLPSQRVEYQPWTSNLVLADPRYHNPGKIDLLLGADICAQILQEGIRRGPNGSPLAQHTLLGWVLSGAVPTTKNIKLEERSITSAHCHMDLESLLRRFWEVEEGQHQPRLSEEEEMCEKFYQKTVKRQDDGRHIVKLPFKSCVMLPLLGSSKEMATRQLFQIERRLRQNPELQKQYLSFMEDYWDQGHMETVTDEVSTNESNYLPHHCVIKESSTTTKLRVVFDASRKTTNKRSLNDNLMVGPGVQEDLFSILTRWRKHKIAFTADIKQMYRQILIDRDDTDFQRILWRRSEEEPISEYRLLTVTYGTASAPYLATRTLKQLAQDESDAYPMASGILLHDFYVDDVLSGGDTIAEVLEIQANLKKLLKLGCFELRKWVTNTEEILASLPKDEREIELPLDITRDISIKALGLHWDPVRDVFQYKVNDIKYQSPTTKRALLSSVSKIFDPLGWLSPVIIRAKIFMQNLWIEGLEWDSHLPAKFEEQWKNYCQNLKDIENIRISRWINYNKTGALVELHVFSDASMLAYAACVYIRVTTEANKINTALLSAKTKVAPIKTVTLPRLELCGALLGSKLLKNVVSALKIQHIKIYSWTDSKIVLAWVKAHPRKWKPFIANRVAEIQTTLHNTHWRYVPSSDNPADCASRGLVPEQLQGHHLWWFGPAWLQLDERNWPQFKNDADVSAIMQSESRVTKIVNAITHKYELALSIIERYSSYSKLTRIVAYCRRFLKNLKAKVTDRICGHLQVKELRETETLLIKTVQRESLLEDYNCLMHQDAIKRSSKIAKLNPFLDNMGIIRVGGRLHNSNLSFNEKHPIILPGDSHLTRLLVEQIHKTTLHGGKQLMLNLLRKTYWIVGARNLAKRVIHDCIDCFRFSAKSRTQLMGNLPAPRVTPSRPFQHTGVDFAGPVSIKAYVGRGNVRLSKGYIAIFICLSTKAIHLEAVTALSTDAFLAAYKRFTGRRGLCDALYSDCGTNFIGASRKLSEEYESCIKSVNPEIVQALALQKIDWHFIPPASPHFGGLWEAGVRSMKHHLRRIVKDVKLTYEELSTTLAQIEACLNSRPLCPVSDDPSNYTVLTPGHFLIGNALLTPPESCLLQHHTKYISRWQLLQKTYQDFWKRWSHEYLTRLQQRPKWLKSEPNVKIGDLVLIKDQNLPPARWLLARITETHPGSDGLVRVVTLQCKNGVFKRPVTKICPLPMNDSTMIQNHHSTSN